ncbi:hypothetical protein WJX72_004053 [[Myrmecia] bisecta]|uniref:(S)-ureidoglycine aminohydrolase cupin domain-containing protein n=1 Tax=[Myrmecia] bisecta TaxID=41462 RepID=A0AAW1P4Y0_9CHLO
MAKIEVLSKGDTAVEELQAFTAFSLEDYLAGASKHWTFWDSPVARFPWTYSKVEYAYILKGKFIVTYEGAEPVELKAGDFVKFPLGETRFDVLEPVRKFFTLV